MRRPSRLNKCGQSLAIGGSMEVRPNPFPGVQFSLQRCSQQPRLIRAGLESLMARAAMSKKLAVMPPTGALRSALTSGSTRKSLWRTL